MSEPLTAERFEQFVEAYTTNHADVVKHLEKIDATLTDHTQRLGRIETQTWQGHRIEEIERRVIKLAELAGDASLATPFSPPLGTAAPVKN